MLDFYNFLQVKVKKTMKFSTLNGKKGFERIMASNFPKLKIAQMKEQLIQRTGLAPTICQAVLEAYYSIMTETLLAGVAFPLAHVGTLTFDVQKVRPAGVYWNPRTKTRMQFLDRQGYYRGVKVRLRKDFKDKLRQETRFGNAPTPEEFEEWAIKTYGREAHEKWKQQNFKLGKGEAYVTYMNELTPEQDLEGNEES